MIGWPVQKTKVEQSYFFLYYKYSWNKHEIGMMFFFLKKLIKNEMIKYFK